MSMIASVLEAGLSLPQDLGRPGRERLGIPAAGAWHRLRYRVLAMLLGHADPQAERPGPAAIELLDGTLALRAMRRMRFAVVGPCRIEVDGEAMPPGTVLETARDCVLRVAHLGPGPVYVGIDGWQPDGILGSVSHDTFARIGLPPIAAGMQLHSRSARPSTPIVVGAFHRPLRDPSPVVRVLVDSCTGLLTDGRWTATVVARSGIRLEGSTVGAFEPVPSRPSNPVMPGAVQVTDAGKPLILGVDGGVTGGYRVAGAVITADLDTLSEVVTGGPVELIAVARPKAIASYQEQEAWLRTCVIRPAAIY